MNNLVSLPTKINQRMRKYLFFAILTITQFTSAQQLAMTLQYDKPADYFEESLPIGNGKMGALVYGGVEDNVIYLNDITLWTGKPVDRDLDRDAHQWLPSIREALFAEDYAKADSLQLHVQGPNSQYYQPLATLHIRDLGQGAVSGYHRQLSLDSALVSDRYMRGGSPISREYFASNPDHLIAIRLRGDINCQLMMTGQTPHQAKASGQQITMTGHAVGDPKESIHFCTILKVKTDGSVAASDSTLTITKASEAIVYLINETSFNGFDKHPVKEGAAYLEKATDAIWHTANINYDEARRNHVADYRQYFDRVKLQLGMPLSYNGTTEQLLREYFDGLRNKEISALPQNSPEAAGIDAVFQYLLPEAAAQIHRAGHAVTDTELMNTVQKCYRELSGRALTAIYPRWIGHTGALRLGAENADEWYGRSVLDILHRRAGLLVRDEQGRLRILHQIMEEYLEEKSRQFHLQFDRVKRRQKLTLGFAAAAAGFFLVTLFGIYNFRMRRQIEEKRRQMLLSETEMLIVESVRNSEEALANEDRREAVDEAVDAVLLSYADLEQTDAMEKLVDIICSAF